MYVCMFVCMYVNGICSVFLLFLFVTQYTCLLVIYSSPFSSSSSSSFWFIFLCWDNLLYIISSHFPTEMCFDENTCLILISNLVIHLINAVINSMSVFPLIWKGIISLWNSKMLCSNVCGWFSILKMHLWSYLALWMQYYIYNCYIYNWMRLPSLLWYTSVYMYHGTMEVLDNQHSSMLEVVVHLQENHTFEEREVDQVLLIPHSLMVNVQTIFA